MKDLPIGTILTVPKNFCSCDFIDYIDGLKLDGEREELGKILGVDYLSNSRYIPVGTMVHNFGNVIASDVWIAWNDIVFLGSFPSLKNHIFRMINRLPDGESKDIWQASYDMDTLPNIDMLFFRPSDVGGHIDEGFNGGYSYHLPVIEHTKNLFKPLGRTTKEEPKKVYSSVHGSEMYETDIPSNLVLLGQDPSIHRLEEPANLIRLGSDGISYPAHITNRVFICVEDHYTGVPNTHKLVIKFK